MSTVHIREALKELKKYAHAAGHDGVWNLALAAEEEVAQIREHAETLAGADVSPLGHITPGACEAAQDLMEAIADEGMP